MPDIPEITLPAGLKYLVEYCEKNCVAGCCGIDAFDFSPLHVASYISARTGDISPGDVAGWEKVLGEAEELVRDLPPNADGFVCSVVGMNQLFTRPTFVDFIGELRHSVRVSRQVLDFSKSLQRGKNAT